MATMTLTKQNLDATLSKNAMVIIDFWASWCGPCRMFAPVFERVSEDFPDIVFAKVDTEAEREVASMFGIQAIPTLAVFREGVGVHQESGALPDRALRDLIKAAQALDMNQVRAEIEAERASQGEVPWELQGDDD